MSERTIENTRAAHAGPTGVVLGVIASAALAGLLVWYVSRVESELVRTTSVMRAEVLASAERQHARAPTTIPDMARLLRTLRLVTVQIDTSVESSSADDSWRGGVLASVRAPVRLYFGTDLAGLNEGMEERGLAARVRGPGVWQGALGGWVVRVPAPRMLAAEVLGGAESEQASVRVGGMRLRDVAGEYHLGLARSALHERARRLALTPQQREAVERITREQLTTLVRAIAGAEAQVDVQFALGDEVSARNVSTPKPPTTAGDPASAAR